MSNSILTDTRELKIDELDVVSGGMSFTQKVISTALLGGLGIGLVASATLVVLETAQNNSK